MATGAAEQAAILRDAPQRCGAPQDEVRSSHSALIPANLTTLPHFSISPTMSLAKSAGEPGSSVPPTSANRVFIFESTSAALTSRLSLSTISAGVPLGAPIPYHWLDS